jgi:PAS domain S-box-containing protein
VADAVDYKLAFEAAAEAQLILDTRGNVLNASEHYLHAVGRTRDEVVGRSLYDLPPYAGDAESSARIREGLQLMLDASLEISTVSLPDARPDAPALWKQARLRAIAGASGKTEHVLHVLDAAPGGRERSETDSERRLHKLVEQTYDAIVLFDAYGQAVYVSPTIQRVLGFSPHEFAQRNSFETVHPDDRARFSEEIARLSAEPGGLLLTRFRAKHRDGGYRVLENTAVNRLHDPDLGAIVATFRDVTQQVELLDELRRSERRLLVALHAARAISWDWSVAERRGRFSSDVGEFFGAPPVGYEGVEEPLFVHPEDRDLLIGAWQRCIDTGEPFKLEYRGPIINGQVRHYAAHGQVVRDSSGRPERVIGVTWDVTERWQLLEERRLLEQRMQESQKLESLGVLAGGIAHDFSNLLMVILGNVSLLQRELGSAHPSLEHVEQMEEATRRATDLCRQLLAYAGKGRFVLQRASINRLIDETTHLLQVSISKKAALQFHLDTSVPVVVVDATQIRQVLMNLVINASDALADRNGTISISTGMVRADRAYLDATFLAPDIPEGDYVYMEVSDTGAGMSPETQARIFDPFFTTKFTGRGLGLAAVLGIVRGHKGALKVYSELGKGSSFKLLLPAAAGAGEAPSLPADRSREQPFANGGTILVVDDEPAVRNVASSMLRDIGFRTLLAEDGNAALAVYRKHASEIVCVLMDLTMPGLDGQETFRELRRIQPDVRVLLMSGYNEQDAISGFVGRGVAGFIQKPFTFSELEQRLRSLLA